MSAAGEPRQRTTHQVVALGKIFDEAFVQTQHLFGAMTANVSDEEWTRELLYQVCIIYKNIQVLVYRFDSGSFDSDFFDSSFYNVSKFARSNQRALDADSDWVGPACKSGSIYLFETNRLMKHAADNNLADLMSRFFAANVLQYAVINWLALRGTGLASGEAMYKITNDNTLRKMNQDNVIIGVLDAQAGKYIVKTLQ